MSARTEMIDHLRVSLALLDQEDRTSLGHGPDDMSIVAMVFAERVCDHHPELADWLACAVRRTARFDPVALAEAILRRIDIPPDSPGGATLSEAFGRLGRAMGASSWAVECHTLEAALLAAEAICVWANGRGQRSPGAPNCPPQILEAAKTYLTERQERVNA